MSHLNGDMVEHTIHVDRAERRFGSSSLADDSGWPHRARRTGVV